MSETKVWSWGIKFGDGADIELYNGAQLLNLKDDLLEKFHFGEKLVTRLDLSHLDTIVFLFKDREQAEVYELAFKMGVTVGSDPISYNQGIKDLWEEMDAEHGDAEHGDAE
jgi:hypothetical protein